MECKVVKKIEVEITTTEMEELSAELEECHCGIWEEPDNLITNVNDMQIYLDNAEAADKESDVVDMVQEALTFANRHHIEEVTFHE